MHKVADDDSNVFFRFLDLYERIGNDFLSLVSKKSTQVRLGSENGRMGKFCKNVDKNKQFNEGHLKYATGTDWPDCATPCCPEIELRRSVSCQQ